MFGFCFVSVFLCRRPACKVLLDYSAQYVILWLFPFACCDDGFPRRRIIFIVIVIISVFLVMMVISIVSHMPRKHRHACTRADTHRRAHARARTHTHTHSVCLSFTHTHTQKHTLSLSLSLSVCLSPSLSQLANTQHLYHHQSQCVLRPLPWHCRDCQSLLVTKSCGFYTHSWLCALLGAAS